MFRISIRHARQVVLFCTLVTTVSAYPAGAQLDKTRYITVDEIRPGMKAYCLTVFKDTKVEKFDLEVLDVIHGWMPGKDAIIVQGTDERFIHTGPVGGCSGSPVYIEGRLAGALAWAWYFSKDPLYVATPIEEMLRVGQANSDPLKASGNGSRDPAAEPGFSFDFSGPIDFAEIDRQLTDSRYWRLGSASGSKPQGSGFGLLPCPLITSGLSSEVVKQLDAIVEPFGFTAVAGLGGGTSSSSEDVDKVELAPGSCLAVPLVTGDIRIEGFGTVTEVVGNKVYAFGHSIIGYGPIDLPMATGRVHTVQSSLMRSSKFASSIDIVGALTADESTAVCGQIGARPRMIPLVISVDRYNDARRRVYNCRLADNRMFTPVMLRLSVLGAVFMLGNLPPDHMLEYDVKIAVEDAEPIVFKNISTAVGVGQMAQETSVPVALLMNNPYEKVNIESVEIGVRIAPKSAIAHIWSAELSDVKVRPGEEVEFEVVVESFLAGKKRYQGSLDIPNELGPGIYNLLLCGAAQYEQFLRKAAPYRFMPRNLPSLIEAINNILAIRRDKLHCVLILPPGGVFLENAELPDLPATKALVLQDAKRTLTMRPYEQWLEESFQTGTVIIDAKKLRLMVKK
ncbi:MAG: SpoIVB peptidase S55 domain-containing protein [Planctomycetota bacterium]|jgi:hypothetical protein